MKYIKILTNSFVLGESGNNGNVISEIGFPKGGLSYVIKNNNIKFYLIEDYFYKNLVWSANLPLMVDGTPHGIATIDQALKGIFVNNGSGGTDITVDTELNPSSLNPIANSPVALELQSLAARVSANAQAILTKANQSDVDDIRATFLSKLEAAGLYMRNDDIGYDASTASLVIKDNI